MFKRLPLVKPGCLLTLHEASRQQRRVLTNTEPLMYGRIPVLRSLLSCSQLDVKPSDCLVVGDGFRWILSQSREFMVVHFPSDSFVIDSDVCDAFLNSFPDKRLVIEVPASSKTMNSDCLGPIYESFCSELVAHDPSFCDLDASHQAEYLSLVKQHVKVMVYDPERQLIVMPDFSSNSVSHETFIADLDLMFQHSGVSNSSSIKCLADSVREHYQKSLAGPFEDPQVCLERCQASIASFPETALSHFYGRVVLSLVTGLISKLPDEEPVPDYIRASLYQLAESCDKASQRTEQETLIGRRGLFRDLQKMGQELNYCLYHLTPYKDAQVVLDARQNNESQILFFDGGGMAAFQGIMTLLTTCIDKDDSPQVLCFDTGYYECLERVNEVFHDSDVMCLDTETHMTPEWIKSHPDIGILCLDLTKPIPQHLAFLLQQKLDNDDLMVLILDETQRPFSDDIRDQLKQRLEPFKSVLSVFSWFSCQKTGEFGLNLTAVGGCVPWEGYQPVLEGPLSEALPSALPVTDHRVQWLCLIAEYASERVSEGATRLQDSAHRMYNELEPSMTGVPALSLDYLPGDSFVKVMYKGRSSRRNSIEEGLTSRYIVPMGGYGVGAFSRLTTYSRDDSVIFRISPGGFDNLDALIGHVREVFLSPTSCLSLTDIRAQLQCSDADMGRVMPGAKDPLRAYLRQVVPLSSPISDVVHFRLLFNSLDALVRCKSYAKAEIAYNSLLDQLEGALPQLKPQDTDLSVNDKTLVRLFLRSGPLFSKGPLSFVSSHDKEIYEVYRNTQVVRQALYRASLLTCVRSSERQDKLRSLLLLSRQQLEMCPIQDQQCWMGTYRQVFKEIVGSFTPREEVLFYESLVDVYNEPLKVISSGRQLDYYTDLVCDLVSRYLDVGESEKAEACLSKHLVAYPTEFKARLMRFQFMTDLLSRLSGAPGADKSLCSRYEDSLRGDIHYLDRMCYFNDLNRLFDVIVSHCYKRRPSSSMIDCLSLVMDRLVQYQFSDDDHRLVNQFQPLVYDFKLHEKTTLVRTFYKHKPELAMAIFFEPVPLSSDNALEQLDLMTTEPKCFSVLYDTLNKVSRYQLNEFFNKALLTHHKKIVHFMTFISEEGYLSDSCTHWEPMFALCFKQSPQADVDLGSLVRLVVSFNRDVKSFSAKTFYVKEGVDMCCSQVKPDDILCYENLAELVLTGTVSPKELEDFLSKYGSITSNHFGLYYAFVKAFMDLDGAENTKSLQYVWERFHTLNNPKYMASVHALLSKEDLDSWGKKEAHFKSRYPLGYQRFLVYGVIGDMLKVLSLHSSLEADPDNEDLRYDYDDLRQVIPGQLCHALKECGAPIDMEDSPFQDLKSHLSHGLFLNLPINLLSVYMKYISLAM